MCHLQFCLLLLKFWTYSEILNQRIQGIYNSWSEFIQRKIVSSDFFKLKNDVGFYIVDKIVVISVKRTKSGKIHSQSLKADNEGFLNK